MTDLIRREDAIEALNNCEDIRGHEYVSIHEALMEIPAVKQEDNKQTNRMPECNEHCIQTEIGCSQPPTA